MNSTKNSFLCEIEASHEGDSGHAEVVAYFDRVSINRKKYRMGCVILFSNTLLIFLLLLFAEEKY